MELFWFVLFFGGGCYACVWGAACQREKSSGMTGLTEIMATALYAPSSCVIFLSHLTVEDA